VPKVKPEAAVGRKTTADLSVKTAAKIGKNAAGLPLAVQIAARPWQEHIVLAVIKQLHHRKMD
jgi:Asp-tRNA(Asn)/Glu-tRNA(Gln) amidotransferase A subunit family amidase